MTDFLAPVISGLIGAAVMGAGSLCTHLITWGRHANTVSNLTADKDKLETRVKALEATGAPDKISALGDRVTKVEGDTTRLFEWMGRLEVTTARVETKLDGVAEHLKDLNASIRWMRDPSSYEPTK